MSNTFGGKRPLHGYNPDAPIQPIQIISGALMMGIVTFGVIAVLMGMNRKEEPGGLILAFIAAGFCGIAFIMRFIIPPLVATGMKQQIRNQKQTTDDFQKDAVLYGIFQTKRILEDAILEGAAFFALVAYLTTVAWWLLAIVGFFLAVMAVTFPTKGRIQNFIQTQKQLMQFEE